MDRWTMGVFDTALRCSCVDALGCRHAEPCSLYTMVDAMNEQFVRLNAPYRFGEVSDKCVSLYAGDVVCEESDDASSLVTRMARRQLMDLLVDVVKVHKCITNVRLRGDDVYKRLVNAVTGSMWWLADVHMCRLRYHGERCSWRRPKSVTLIECDPVASDSQLWLAVRAATDAVALHLAECTGRCEAALESSRARSVRVRGEIFPFVLLGNNTSVELFECAVPILREEHLAAWFPSRRGAEPLCPNLRTVRVVLERVDSYTTLVRLASRMSSALEHVVSFEIEVYKVYSNVYDVDCGDFVSHVRTECPRVTTLALTVNSRDQCSRLGVVFGRAGPCTCVFGRQQPRSPERGTKNERDAGPRESVQTDVTYPLFFPCERFSAPVECEDMFTSHQLVELSVKKWHTTVGVCPQMVFRMAYRVSAFLKVALYARSDWVADCNKIMPPGSRGVSCSAGSASSPCDQRFFCECRRLNSLEAFEWTDLSTDACSLVGDHGLLASVLTRSPKLRVARISGLRESSKLDVLDALRCDIPGVGKEAVSPPLERLNLGGARFEGDEEVRRLASFLAACDSLVELECIDMPAARDQRALAEALRTHNFTLRALTLSGPVRSSSLLAVVNRNRTLDFRITEVITRGARANEKAMCGVPVRVIKTRGHSLMKSIRENMMRNLDECIGIVGAADGGSKKK